MEHIRCWAAGIGAVLGEFIGTFDSLLYALVLFVTVDYITGVLSAAVEGTLSSQTGFRGICQKICLFALVGVADILDTHILGGTCVLRTAVIFFYLSNEGISILENTARIGVPIPGKLREVLEQLKKK